MPTEKSKTNGTPTIPSGEELGRMLDNGEWDKVKELLTPTEEEVDRALQEPTIDGAEVNRMLEISDEEIESSKTGNGEARSILPDLLRAIENRDWPALDRLVGMSPEEAERILRDEPMIDAADFNRRMEALERDEENANASQGFDVPTTRGESAGVSTPSP